jgi:hypothetical protein
MAKAFLDQNFSAKIRRAVDRKMSNVFARGNLLLERQANILREAFASSPEFNEMKTSQLGQFGFTPEELAQLDKVLQLLVPGNHNITVSQIRTTPGRSKLLLLQWVNFEELTKHPFTQHELTRLDEQGNVIEITDVISWVEWLERGATFRGFQFFKPGGTFQGGQLSLRSRSGEGLMRKVGGVFIIEPTRIFERLGSDRLLTLPTLQNGFGILVRRFAR